MSGSACIGFPPKKQLRQLFYTVVFEKLENCERFLKQAALGKHTVDRYRFLDVPLRLER